MPLPRLPRPGLGRGRKWGHEKPSNINRLPRLPRLPRLFLRPACAREQREGVSYRLLFWSRQLGQLGHCIVFLIENHAPTFGHVGYGSRQSGHSAGERGSFLASNLYGPGRPQSFASEAAQNLTLQAEQT